MAFFAAGNNRSYPYFRCNFRRADGRVTSVDYPTVYFRSPQYDYNDYDIFPNNPRQLQAALAGVIHKPLRMVLPSPTPQQQAHLEYLITTAEVGEECVEPQVLAKIIKQATITNTVGGVPKEAQMKKGERFERNSVGLFNKQNTMDPQAALQQLNEKLNKGLSIRNSMAQNLRQSLSSAGFNETGNASAVLGNTHSSSILHQNETHQLDELVAAVIPESAMAKLLAPQNERRVDPTPEQEWSA